tara:strand:- start:8428 stop:8598 length:171 start_codon:yes stop_codon:yes gene_type:complete
MWNQTFYKVTFRDEVDGEQKSVIISASHTVDRIREILSEAHPNWQIQDIVAKEPKP